MPARTVLVVDDEPTIRETVADALGLDGHRVVTAATGPDALAAFRGERPDLVILDLMLPELSGIEVCRIIRAESVVPVIMLTARDSELDKVVGLEVGADDYVTKPFSLRELSARVRATFRRLDQAGAATVGASRPADAGAAAEPELLALGAAQVDLAGHLVLRDGAPVPLKPRAFSLLTFLLRHQGQVVTREQLLEQVWGTDYPGETRTVDVHVHMLREAIEADPANPTLLQTVRGVGYVLRRPPGGG